MPGYLTLPKDEFKGRVARLQSNLAAAGLGGVLLIQNTDRYYFTGTLQSGFVVIPVKGDPLVAVRKDYDRAVVESAWPVTKLASTRGLAHLVRETFGELPSPLGMEYDVLPVKQAKMMEKLFEGAEFADASHQIMYTRAIKSEEEIDAIRIACEQVDRAVSMVAGIVKPGMTERELSARIEYELRLSGHAGRIEMRGFNQWIFYGHVLSGRGGGEPSGFDMPTSGIGASPFISQGASDKVIEIGDAITVDLMGSNGGYLCDQTRLFSLGELKEPLKGAFAAAVAIEEEVAAMARPGVSASELYEKAVELADATPYGKNFLGDGAKVSFVGHGLGVEVDEYPFLARGFKMPLEEGMVFALEPKFIFRDLGAVGIEDTYVVRADGAEQLTTSPKSLITVE